MATNNTTDNFFFLEDPADFDKNRLVIHDPEVQTFQVGGKTQVKITSSRIGYLDEEGNEKEMLFPAPPQQCFGVSYSYDIKLKTEEQEPSKAKGVQVCYPMTSLTTMAKPLPAEKALMNMMNEMHKCLIAKGQSEAARDKALLPDNVINAFLAEQGKSKPVWSKVVKVPYEYPKDKNDKTKIDKTKPQRAYFPLVKSGEGEKLRVLSRFYGPGDKLVNPIRYVNVRGVITPIIHLKSVYWGAHGPTSPIVASLKFEIVEATYAPNEGGSAIPSRRFVGANTAPSQDDDDEEAPRPRSRAAAAAADEDDEDDGDEDFARPGNDAKNPVKALSTTKGKPAKAEVASAKDKAPVSKSKPAKAAAEVTTPAAAAKGKSAKAAAPKSKPKREPTPPPSDDEDDVVASDADDQDDDAVASDDE